jgi:hypothetical protein
VIFVEADTDGFAKLSNRRRVAEKSITATPNAGHRAGQRISHVLTELRVEKSPLHGGRGWIKVEP